MIPARSVCVRETRCDGDIYIDPNPLLAHVLSSLLAIRTTASSSTRLDTVACWSLAAAGPPSRVVFILTSTITSHTATTSDALPEDKSAAAAEARGRRDTIVIE
jgi:hypothetical protein